MKILLIGNGFDLEHRLPTSYKNFLEFCNKASKIYTYGIEVPLSVYENKYLNEWEMDNNIKKILSDAFNERQHIKSEQKNGVNDYKFETPNKLLDELNNCIDNNAWINFFMKRFSVIGENWIDFESEISKVIQILDEARTKVINGESVKNIQKDKYKILELISDVSKESFQDVLREMDIFREMHIFRGMDIFINIRLIDKFIPFLDTELEKLIRALEIYIAEFVNKITITKKSADIEQLNPDHILSFNYSDTYERIYGKDKKIDYAYIHGKADINKNVITSNLVLGIDEYLDDNRKDEELEFLIFKKFYQRIYKSTGNDYLDWVDEIKDGYANFLKEKSDAYARAVESLKDGSLEYPYEKNVCRESLNIECPEHTLYIFGHSLDVTDRDILKMFICNDNVKTKIFYYRENKDDKKVLGKLIRNLIRIMGQDELLRRTGGIHKTIEFIPQTISEEEK